MQRLTKQERFDRIVGIISAAVLRLEARSEKSEKSVSK